MPDIKISKKEKDISKEIVFAGRYLVIEIQSGVPLYNAMVNMSKNYEIIGHYFKEVTDKVDFWTSMEDALNEAVEFIPSKDFRRILWQIINSLRTGSDISKSLSTVLEQIMREQAIEVNKYGRKLNPLAIFSSLFYLLRFMVQHLGCYCSFLCARSQDMQAKNWKIKTKLLNLNNLKDSLLLH